MGFSALVAITAFLFILWHTWHYDRFRCVVYSKRDWFRALMVQILLAAIGIFVLYTWIEAAILYDEVGHSFSYGDHRRSRKLT
jgi:membrane-anchored protein YejM (alkaline phosphatase superfamily)